ncbi:MAG: tetratricopeptide repeat protein [Candidatus Sulfopaludibacter sp.]|nr:tetratricopeptide repeat protein [Candidatus Sulfopaludibacter sp.]
MRSIRVLSLVLFVLASFISCSRDPNVAKKHYLDTGNKYFDKQNYKAAMIMYRNALEKDKRYGPAYYKLALAQIQLGQISPAINSLRRSVELNKPNDPAPAVVAAHWDSVVKLSEIYMAGSRDPQLLGEVDQNVKDILARYPNSWDGHRLKGDLAFIHALQAFQTANKDELKRQTDLAMSEYRKAESIKPGEVSVQMQLARTMASAGDFAGAEQLYRQVLDRDKNLQVAYSELYKLFIFQNKPDEGEKVLKLAAQNNPKQYSFLTALAAHYAVLHRRDDMVKVLQDIKSHAKDYPEAYLKVGDFYLRLGDGDSAIREYNEGLQKDKDAKRRPEYQKRKIEVLMRQGKRAEAADVNQQLLKENPNDSDAKGLAASLLLDKGEISRALTELQSVVTRAPDNFVARFNLGRAYAMNNQPEQARQAFTKVIEQRPDYIPARVALAQLLLLRNELDSAMKAAQQILAIDPNNNTAKLTQSAVMMGQKKYGDSRLLLDSMLKANPSSPDVYFQLGVLDLAEAKFKDADTAFRKTYELNPTNPRGLMGMVETDMAQHKTDDALKLLKTESDKSPTNMDLVTQLGNISVRAGRFDEGIADFQRALDSLDKTSKKRGNLLLRIGETYRLKGDPQNAIAYLQKAREVLPEDPGILGTLALVLDNAGRWTDAEQVYQATIKMDPNNGVLLNNAAFILAEHGGDLNSAMTMAQKAKQLYPNLAEVSDTIGWIYLKKGMADSAIDTFRDLVNKQPHASTYRYHLGVALAQKGDKPAALREFQTALKDNPPKAERDQIQEQIQKIG